MSNTNIFYLTANSSTAIKLRANRRRLSMLIQNETGETVYIGKDENFGSALLILNSGNVYETESTDELFLWATGTAKLTVVEEVAEN